MGELNTVCQYQKLDRDPSPEQIPTGRLGIVEDGMNLPNTVCEEVRSFSLLRNYSPTYSEEGSETTENIRGFSIAPQYSLKQLREIRRRNIGSWKTISRNFPAQRNGI
jgi:hypothetical protein